MGEVYLARDTRLDRRVAVKVLAPDLAADPDFRQRFAREARALSALNHPHICRLYDVCEDEEAECLVLELIEGESVAARLERGPLPLGQVLRFAIQIADALEAAHSHGIIHRDLKPANVMLTPAGVKLVDFGIAKKAPGVDAEGGSVFGAAGATATAEGTIIGTLQYMAPEQLQGERVDARTDIFALGAIVYEMATGRRAFEGATQASLIAKILETEPPAISLLAPLTPPALDHLVETCLAKAPSDRWQSAHDIKLQLQFIERQASRLDLAATASAMVSGGRIAWVPWTIAISSAVLAAALYFSSRSVPGPAPRLRFDLSLPPHMSQLDYSGGAISPDGQRFVFEALVNGRQHLVLQDLATTEMVVLGGTDLSFNPFWSPDSRVIAFFHPDGHLKTLPVEGGAPRVIAGAKYEESVDIEGTWRHGTIVFGPSEARIYRVPETGGTPTPIETSAAGAPPRTFTNPRFLPDGRQFLLSVSGGPGIYVASLDSPGARKITEEGASAQYAAGHLFYFRGTSLFARPFDPERLALSGSEVQVMAGAGHVSLSDNATIVYRPSGVVPVTLTWFDRNGRRTGSLGEPGPYDQVVLSPRARRATIVRLEPDGNGDLWDVDLANGIFSRLTTHPAFDSDPVWAPDERALAFTTFRTGRGAVFVKDLTSGKEDQLVQFDEAAAVDHWTQDARFIVFRTFGKAVYAMPLAGDRKPRLLRDTPYVEDEVHVSPDGRWVAFNADESGRWEVYVAAFPTFTSKRQVSSGGGVQPQWRRDGQELFYLGLDGSMMSVRVTAAGEVTASAPTVLFGSRIAASASVPQYAVTPDGQSFLGLERVAAPTNFTFLLNWLDTVRR
jgi:serine/threonine protein kinase/Tol biopolymer transport system component